MKSFFLAAAVSTLVLFGCAGTGIKAVDGQSDADLFRQAVFCTGNGGSCEAPMYSSRAISKITDADLKRLVDKSLTPKEIFCLGAEPKRGLSVRFRIPLPPSSRGTVMEINEMRRVLIEEYRKALPASWLIVLARVFKPVASGATAMKDLRGILPVMPKTSPSSRNYGTNDFIPLFNPASREISLIGNETPGIDFQNGAATRMGASSLSLGYSGNGPFGQWGAPPIEPGPEIEYAGVRYKTNRAVQFTDVYRLLTEYTLVIPPEVQEREFPWLQEKTFDDEPGGEFFYFGYEKDSEGKLHLRSSDFRDVNAVRGWKLFTKAKTTIKEFPTDSGEEFVLELNTDMTLFCKYGQALRDFSAK